MMSFTHLAVGAGTALAVMHPNDPKGCCLAVIGGFLGGVIPDADILQHDYKKDALKGQIIAFLTTACLFLADRIIGFNIFTDFPPANIIWLNIGLILFAVLYVICLPQPHRGFSHSLLAMALFSVSIAFIYRPLLPFFLLGFASHIVIDLLNKRGVKVFFPANLGICLRLCTANGLANSILQIVGFVVAIVFLINGLFLHYIV